MRPPLSRGAMGKWRWVALVLLLLFVAVSNYFRTEGPADVGRPDGRNPPVEAPAPSDEGPTSAPRTEPKVEFHDLTIRDEEGHVAYRGSVDLTNTLERIARGKRLQYRSDGSTFENREGRLPKKEHGHYREYIHPTPGLSGPGPQRIVVGSDGETYYTPDHYRSFHPVRERLEPSRN